MYVDLGRDKEAFAVLIETHQDQAVASYNLGYLYLQRRRLDEAITQMEAAISNNPDLEIAARWLNRLEMEDPPKELEAAYLSLDDCIHSDG